MVAQMLRHSESLAPPADSVSLAPLQLEQLYSSVAWPLYKLYGHAFDAFKVMVQDPDAVFSKLLEVGGEQRLLSPALPGPPHHDIYASLMRCQGLLMAYSTSNFPERRLTMASPSSASQTR